MEYFCLCQPVSYARVNITFASPGVRSGCGFVHTRGELPTPARKRPKLMIQPQKTFGCF